MSQPDPSHRRAASYAVSPATQACLARPLFGHVIDGAVVPSLDGATMPVIYPGDGEQVATAALGSVADVERAARSARAAFDDGRWRHLAPFEKERRLRRLATLLGERAEEFAEIDVLDSGLPRSITAALTQYAIDGIDYYAGWPTKMRGAIPPVPEGLVAYETREPIGVIGMITPWNGPVAYLGYIAGALSAGNSVVMKPAEQTPMSAVLMAEIAVEAGIPPGVFNVVQGMGETVGAAVVLAPEIDSISFTGSGEVGRIIQAAAATRLKRTCLELGGKSPHIIFPDADLEAAAAAARAGVWTSAGQVCTSGSRVFVHHAVYDEVVQRIVDGSRDLRIGSPLDLETQLGPVVSAAQLQRVEEYVAIGRSEGAELVLGGTRCQGNGFFHEPTIFTSVHNDMRIAQEEIFGPVMSVLPFSTEQEVFALANATEFGLAAGVWTSDLGLAHRASRALRAGTVWVNMYMMLHPTTSFGGVKQSGHGRQFGWASIDEVTEIKSTWMSVA